MPRFRYILGHFRLTTTQTPGLKTDYHDKISPTPTNTSKCPLTTMQGCVTYATDHKRDLITIWSGFNKRRRQLKGSTDIKKFPEEQMAAINLPNHMQMTLSSWSVGIRVRAFHHQFEQLEGGFCQRVTFLLKYNGHFVWILTKKKGELILIIKTILTKVRQTCLVVDSTHISKLKCHCWWQKPIFHRYIRACNFYNKFCNVKFTKKTKRARISSIELERN